MPIGIQELRELQYSGDGSSPISDDIPSLWHDINDIVDDIDTFNNPYRPPSHHDSNITNSQENFSIKRYYIRKSPVDASRYTSFRIKLKATARTFGSDTKVILGIRQIDFTSIIYGDSGELWFQYTNTGTSFTLDEVRPRVLNIDVVGAYLPEVTPYVVDTGTLIEVPIGSTIAHDDTFYIKMTMDSGGSGDTPVIAGIVLEITQI
jgi:hypothetical protein